MNEPRQPFRRTRARRERSQATDKLSGLMWVVTIGLGAVLVLAIAYIAPTFL